MDEPRPHAGADDAPLAAAQRQMADMRAAHEAFLHGVAHDLRAPLRHVTSYGALLRELLQELPGPRPQVDEALDFTAAIGQAARRMGLMIDGLHAIARAGSAPLRLGAVDLHAAVRDARAGLARAEAGRAVRWDIAPPMPAVRADADLLRQLLAQALDNALKFTRARADARITVQAASAAGAQGQPCVRITIGDNGVGFDGARAQRLFGVFQRMHRESEFDGVGAGLALCQTIAQRHGATISAHATPGEGCTLTLDWPAA